MTPPKITQAMIDLYDHFTHEGLDRRALMTGLARLAGGTAAAAAILPLIEASPAAASIVADDDKRVIAKTVEWPGGTVHRLSGYLVRPAVSNKLTLGAVMVIHENRGLTEHIRDVARRLALEGFIVLAPDFLSPDGGTPADEDKARAMIGALGRDATVADGVATLDYMAKIRGANARVGTVGFCWGGGMVNAVACAAGARLRAAVAYYGPQPPVALVPAIKARMLLHYGGLDQRIDAGIAAYEAALKAANVKYEVFVYPDANHAFNNDTSAERYNKAAADLAWSRTTAMLHDSLG
ncbi:dienelactone hydrolase family protein [Glacieibacterium megasporae]|uniref:dienelactone hydrolase family protein n=1 Tax=Glacieibacterium megasporae TaxID=2835787 RepID=UPI001C1E323B|nr:dienelactone hydrolase family protein [Polymorphobacter megasporae]UAJ09992.1 dienelactone hydrolase family protein [Polymorphobacter megasporae]